MWKVKVKEKRAGAPFQIESRMELTDVLDTIKGYVQGLDVETITIESKGAKP